VTAMAVTASESRPARPQRDGRLGRAIKEAVLTVVGLVGLLAIVWLICAMAFGLSIVVFKTGSMAPAIPTGSAAVVREVRASQVQVGDVITVQREGASLPVTHRVVSVSADPVNPDARIVELRGDANESNDLAPYTITEAKRVLASFPGFGVALAVMRSPYFLGVTTVAVGLLTVWAFWPQRRASRHRVSS
jgi:signal peptidase